MSVDWPALTPTLPSNQRFDGSLFFSLPVRNERGESRREGPSRGITPPLPGPLLPPASGREGEKARCPGGYGARSARKVRGILSPRRGRATGVSRWLATSSPQPQVFAISLAARSHECGQSKPTAASVTPSPGAADEVSAKDNALPGRGEDGLISETAFA